MSPATPEYLQDRGWLAAPPLSAVLDALNGEGVETRVVGGAVRDSLMGRAPGDVDCATTADTDTVMARAAAAGLKAVPTGVAHGTVTVVAQGRPFEVTTLRRDVETHGRRATVAFGADWEEDARRRDFSINALYADRDGRLHDPVGGYPDIMARRVRFIGDPTARIREDYLRILRFFRFHAQFASGAPDADGLAAAIRERKGVNGLSGERLRQEMFRLLAAPGAVPTLEVMADCGILGIVTGGVAYVASLARLADIEIDAAAPAHPVPRLAALAARVPEDADRLTTRLRLSNAERDRLRSTVDGWWHVSPSLAEAGRKQLLYRLGPQAYRDRVALAFARSGAAADDPDWRAILDLPARWTAPVFPLKGRDLLRLGLPGGPELGEVLARLEAEWIAEDFSTDRESLLERAVAGRA